MDTILRYIQLKAFGRGLRGYHTAWLVVGAAAWDDQPGPPPGRRGLPHPPQAGRAPHRDDQRGRVPHRRRTTERRWGRAATGPPCGRASRCCWSTPRAPLSDHPAARGLVPHPCGHRRPRPPHRPPGGVDRARQHRPALPGGATHPGRRRPQDAPGRPGHLPEGPRGHPHRGGHRPRGPGARGRVSVPGPCRWRCSGPAPRWSATSCARRLRRAGEGQRDRHARSGRCPTGWRSATSTRASSESGLDRVLLDLPEPWRVLRHAESRPCARAGSSVPTCPRSTRPHNCGTALDRSGFGMASTLEVLHRTWHVEPRSVRPDHRMVGHTGFLTTGPAAPALRRTPQPVRPAPAD